MTAPLLPPTTFGSSEVARRLGISTSLLRTWITQLNWAVPRNADGHRVFSEADLEDLLALKAWVSDGSPLRAFKRPGDPEPEPASPGLQPGGPADLRFELRLGYRRMHELASQADAAWARVLAVHEAQAEAQAATLARLEALRAEETERAGLDRTRLVQGLLKQVLAEVLARRGALKPVEAAGPWRAYLTPQGHLYELSDVLETPAEREVFEAVLRALAGPPSS